MWGPKNLSPFTLAQRLMLKNDKALLEWEFCGGFGSANIEEPKLMGFSIIWTSVVLI